MRIALKDHPRWKIYQALRLAIRREIAASIGRLQLGVSEDDVDGYLRCNAQREMKELGAIFRADLETRESLARDSIRELLEEIDIQSRRASIAADNHAPGGAF